MLGSLKRAVVIAEVRHAHQKHRHNALHRRRHWIRHRIVNAFRSVRIIERQKYDVIRCKLYMSKLSRLVANKIIIYKTHLKRRSFEEPFDSSFFRRARARE